MLYFQYGKKEKNSTKKSTIAEIKKPHAGIKRLLSNKPKEKKNRNTQRFLKPKYFQRPADIFELFFPRKYLHLGAWPFRLNYATAWLAGKMHFVF
jgi:hypothetical protein